MPRAAPAADIYTAIAEPRRRRLVEVLARDGAAPVNQLVREMRLPQPAVSKHLGVLRAVGLVSVDRRGQQRLYSLNAGELKAVYDWTATFARFWQHKLERIKERAERAHKESH